MNRYFIRTTIASGLLFFAVPAFCQDRDRDRDGDRDRDSYYNQTRDESFWKGRLFDRVREDIDRVQANTPAFSADEFRLARAKQELSELQRDATSGRFADKDLEDVVRAINRVVADNRMPDRDRRLLSDDVSRLQEYKEHHERYYPRG